METFVQRVAVVGVGRMGAAMARRLAERGFAVTAVFDARRAAAEELAAELGAAAPATLAEVSAAAETVVTVVSDDAAMRAIFAPEGDSLLGAATGRTFLNCATLTPAVHVEVEALARRAGAVAIEGCMASSITQARAGTLYLMLGGDRTAVERLRPMLEALASTVRYVGPAGSAAQVKALVNMVMNANTAALAEGLGLGDALGLDLTMLREVFSQTGAASRVLETDGEDMQNREHEVYFSAAHAAKDSHIALALAAKHGLALPVSAAAAAQFDLMTSRGLGELDKSGVAELTFRGRTPAPAETGSR